MALVKHCLHCNTVFFKPRNESQKDWSSRHKYCSRQCANQSKIGRKQSPESSAKKRLVWLGRKHAPESLLKMSGPNGNNWKGGWRNQLPNCPDCGTQMSSKLSKFCYSCRILRHNTGPEASRWEGGITPLNSAVRGLRKYKNWRKSILKRDGSQCVMCGNRNDIHVDHVYPLCLILEDENIQSVEDALASESLWDHSNGRVLCEGCHEATDTYKGRASVMKKQRQLRLGAVAA